MIQTAFRGTRPEFIHTLEIDVTALRTRSNNRGIDLGGVDDQPATPARPMITDCVPKRQC
jgi:hypothetical protein